MLSVGTPVACVARIFSLICIPDMQFAARSTNNVTKSIGLGFAYILRYNNFYEYYNWYEVFP